MLGVLARDVRKDIGGLHTVSELAHGVADFTLFDCESVCAGGGACAESKRRNPVIQTEMLHCVPP